MASLLLTGARGFTGEHLSKAAVAAGFEVFPLVSDLVDADSVRDEVAELKPDYVIHLAAISAVTHADEEAFYRVNLFGSLNLLQALSDLRKSPARVVIASSANVYGNAGKEGINESICPAPVNHYSVSKLAMEHMSKTFLDRLPIVLTRPFNYTGPGHDDRFVIPKIVKHFVSRSDLIELGNIDVEREFNDIRMVCDTYLKLLKYGLKGEVYNICSGKPISLKCVISTLESLTGHGISVAVNPEFVRPNEIQSLYGDAGKLEGCIGNLTHPSLEDTLNTMLAYYE